MRRALINGSLPRWLCEGGVAIIFAWTFSYEAMSGAEYPWILWLSMIALGMLAVDVGFYFAYHYLSGE